MHIAFNELLSSSQLHHLELFRAGAYASGPAAGGQPAGISTATSASTAAAAEEEQRDRGGGPEQGEDVREGDGGGACLDEDSDESDEAEACLDSAAASAAALGTTRSDEAEARSGPQLHTEASTAAKGLVSDVMEDSDGGVNKAAAAAAADIAGHDGAGGQEAVDGGSAPAPGTVDAVGGKWMEGYCLGLSRKSFRCVRPCRL